MDNRSIIIIGGGIAGLSAGCYGQMNGFQTRIFEMHRKKPGGLCTSWKRQGFTVNGCLHWLVGTHPQSDYHRLWRELGALEGKQIVDYEEYARTEFLDGKQVIVYSDIDRLERHLKETAPEDHGLIDEFIEAVRVCTRSEPPFGKAPELMNVFDVIVMIVTRFPLLRLLWKWNKISLSDFGNRFKSPYLRKIFPMLFMPDFPMTFMLMTLGWMHTRNAGYPIGGSLEFSRAIERRYLDLGGEMRYQSRVVKILTEQGRAVGVMLADGTEHRADYVISAADGQSTIFEMLEGRHIDAEIRGYYETLIPFPPLVYVALGVARSFSEFPSSAGGLSLELPEPLNVGGVLHDFLDVHVYNYDPTLAPEGKTLLVVMLRTEYDYWSNLRPDDERYKAEKEKVAEQVVSLLDRRFPGLSGQVEMRDVSSPTTFVRYTGNWKGSFEGWQVTPKTWSLGRVMKKTLPGLDNFYMAGQWVEPGGGLPPAAMSGRNVIQMICKKERRKFWTSEPR